MATEMKNLQKLIEDRAATRLRQDLVKLGKLMATQPLLKEGPKLAYNQFHGQTKEGSNEPKVGWVSEDVLRLFEVDGYNTPWGYYLRQLETFWLPKYIAQESLEFLKKVDELKTTVDDLLNNMPS